MKLLLTPALVALLSFSPTPQEAPATTETLVQVIVLGTFHMGAAGDALNPNVADLSSERRQRELEQLVEELAEFAPTKVALEALASAMPTLSKDFEAYLRGELEQRRDERYQVGFRLAARLGHERLFGVDHEQTLDPLECLSWAEAHGQPDVARAINSGYGALTKSWSSAFMAESSMLEIFRAFNSRETDDALNDVFMSFLRIGSDVEPVGPTMLSKWYERNLQIAANVVRLAKPGDRVLVLIGANHRKLLIEFLSRTPGVEVLEAAAYLGGDD